MVVLKLCMEAQLSRKLAACEKKKKGVDMESRSNQACGACLNERVCCFHPCASGQLQEGIARTLQ